MYHAPRRFAAWIALGVLLFFVNRAFATEPTTPAAAGPTEAAPATSNPEHRPAQPVDVSFVPADAAIAVIMRPQTLLAGPNAEWMPVEVITAVGTQEFGVDPVQIDETTVFLVPPPAARPNEEPAVGVVVRFMKPYAKAAILAKLTHPLSAEFDGKTLYLLAGPGNNCVTFPDDHTIIFGARKTVTDMLTAKNVDSPLVKMMKSTDCSGTYTVLASFDAMRDLITEGLAKTPPLPPALDQFRKIPMLISSAKIQLDLTNGADFSVTLHAIDDQAAGELLDLLNNGIAMGRQIVLGQVRQSMGNPSNDPVQQAAGKYSARLVNLMFDKVKPIRAGQNIKMAVTTESGPMAVGVMVALLLPAVQAAREAAYRNQSQGKMKQLGLALLNYESAYGRLPQRAICDKQGKPLLSWRVAMLPYLEEGQLYKEFHLDEAWDSPHNKPLIARIPDSLCNPHRPKDGKTNYLVPVGSEFAFDSKTTANGGRTIADITDGTSRTIAILEADEDRAVIWTKPEDLEINPANPLAGLGHFNTNGNFFAVFFDDHVQVVPGTVDPQVFKASLTIAGGENVRLPLQ
jgi:hypothetical protein